MLLFFINYCFLLLLVIRSFMHLLKYMRQSPKLAHIYLVLTCSKLSLEESRKQMQQVRAKEQKSEEQMRQIDTMILHLTNVQNEMVKMDET